MGMEFTFGEECYNIIDSQWGEVCTDDESDESVDDDGECFGPMYDECHEGYFCNMDGGLMMPGNGCEGCSKYMSIEDCYMDGLPDMGAQHCHQVCFGGDDMSEYTTDYPMSDDYSDDSECVNIKVEVGAGYFPGEITWNINGGECQGVANANVMCCVSSNQITVECLDSYGDGWNGAHMLINDEFEVCKHQFGSFYSQGFYVNNYDGGDYSDYSWDDNESSEESYESSDDYSSEEESS